MCGVWGVIYILMAFLAGFVFCVLLSMDRGCESELKSTKDKMLDCNDLDDEDFGVMTTVHDGLKGLKK